MPSRGGFSTNLFAESRQNPWNEIGAIDGYYMYHFSADGGSGYKRRVYLIKQTNALYAVIMQTVSLTSGYDELVGKDMSCSGASDKLETVRCTAGTGGLGSGALFKVISGCYGKCTQFSIYFDNWYAGTQFWKWPEYIKVSN